MSYGFYTLVRIISATTFAYFSYQYFKAKKEKLAFLFAALTLLFQPFFKLTLGRFIWNVVDVFIALVLLVLAIKDFRDK